MLTYKRASWLLSLGAAAILLGCTGADGLPGKNGANGANGDAGPPGNDGDAGVVPPLQNDVSGTVTDGTSPLQGVTVSAAPGAAMATTDAAGAFALDALPVGAYALTFSATGYLDKTVNVAVSLAGPTTVSVAMAVDVDSGTPPTVTVADQLKAGFDKAVTITATATGTGTLTYAWTQTSGPTVALTGADTATVSFQTQDLPTALGPAVLKNARYGVVGVNPDKAGNYGFQVTVTDPVGHATTAKVTVNATRTTTGLRMVPLGVPVWLQGNGPLMLLTPLAPATVGVPQTTWSWTLDTSGAPGSTATLSDPTAQFPSFTPDVAGVYKLTETVQDTNKSAATPPIAAAPALSIYAGPWMGEMTQTVQDSCGLCHGQAAIPKATDNFTPWKKTAHYSSLQRKIEGSVGPHFTEECLSCHTVGYDKTAANNGFDDVQKTSGWQYPATLEAGNWSTLLSTPALGQLAGIQCESCHGPQVQGGTSPHSNSVTQDYAARVSWSSDVCSSCHQDAPLHFKPGQWETSKHGDLTLSLLEATVETRGVTAAHCGRCHSAQGYAQYVKQLKQGYNGQLTSDGKPATGSPQTNVATIASLTTLGLTQAAVISQSCQTCHDPHDATNPAQLRIYDSVASLPNGMTNISGMGTGLVCATCHNTRNGEHTDFVAAPAAYSAPHAAAQADTVFGFNAYFVARYTPSPHLAVENTCAGCHYKAVTASDVAAKQTSNHSFAVDNTICSTCHAPGVDGNALQAAYQAELDALGKLLDQKVLNLVNAALLPANGAGYTLRVWDPVSDQYSSAAAANVLVTVAPTSITNFEVHGSVGFIFHMAAPVTVALVNAAGNPAGSITTTDLYVQGSSLKNAAGTTALFAANSDYLRGLWNWYLLHGDNTKGIHNPSFYDAVIAATTTKASALP
jgi:hypothetical protein